jgi:hypothetical protein
VLSEHFSAGFSHSPQRRFFFHTEARGKEEEGRFHAAAATNRCKRNKLGVA